MRFRPALACTALLLAAPLAAEPAAQPDLLAVFAHPDDEVTVAPLLARAAREGFAVRIVYATSGDAGPGVSGLAKGAALAAAREGEARCASAALGLGTPQFLRFGDGELWREARGTDDAGRNLQAEIAGAIAAARPAVVVTWGPDGGYGHADHRLVSDFVTQAVQALGEADRPALLYPGIRTGTLPPLPEMQTWAVTDPALLAVPVSYDPADLAAAARAAECHATQFDPATRAGMMPMFDGTIWQGAVHLREAFGRPFAWPPAARQD